jgi:hypothetical protein
LIDAKSGNVDTYSKAHLTELNARIEKALDASYVINKNDGGSGLGMFLRTATPQTSGGAGATRSTAPSLIEPPAMHEQGAPETP